jgi:hypothetical protein
VDTDRHKDSVMIFKTNLFNKERRVGQNAGRWGDFQLYNIHKNDMIIRQLLQNLKGEK